MNKRSFFYQFVIGLITVVCLSALPLEGSQFTVGEKLKYSIFAGGIRVANPGSKITVDYIYLCLYTILTPANKRGSTWTW